MFQKAFFPPSKKFPLPILLQTCILNGNVGAVGCIAQYFAPDGLLPIHTFLHFTSKIKPLKYIFLYWVGRRNEMLEGNLQVISLWTYL